MSLTVNIVHYEILSEKNENESRVKNETGKISGMSNAKLTSKIYVKNLRSMKTCCELKLMVVLSLISQDSVDVIPMLFFSCACIF